MKPLRHLGMSPRTSSDWLELLQDSDYLGLGIDAYNSGEAITLLETRVAELLGKPAALFYPKGMAAQFAMLKAVEERTANSNVVLHPLSHLAWDEREAYDHLLQLKAMFIGSNDAPISVADLNQISTSPASMIVELPLRRAGFRITPFDDLIDISN